jgi:hypothetical protein
MKERKSKTEGKKVTGVWESVVRFPEWASDFSRSRSDRLWVPPSLIFDALGGPLPQSKAAGVRG